MVYPDDDRDRQLALRGQVDPASALVEYGWKFQGRHAPDAHGPGTQLGARQPGGHHASAFMQQAFVIGMQQLLLDPRASPPG